MELSFRITTFDEWRRQSLPLTLWPNHEWIPVINNPMGIIRYDGLEVFTRTLLFPVAASFDGRDVACAMTYNVSDTSVRIRGLYVEPAARGKGIGPKLCDFALSLWPRPWNRCVGYWRTDAFAILEKHWGLKGHPDFKKRLREYLPNQYLQEYKIIFGYKDF